MLETVNRGYESDGGDHKVILAGSNNSEFLIRNLFESGFFMNLSTFFFEDCGIPELRDMEGKESIIGLMLGISISDRTLIRNSLINIVGNEIKAESIHGFFGALLNDLEVSKEIKILAKFIGLNPGMLINLITLITEETHVAKLLPNIV